MMSNELTANPTRLPLSASGTSFPSFLTGDHRDLLFRRKLGPQNKLNLLPGEQVYVVLDGCVGSCWWARMKRCFIFAAITYLPFTILMSSVNPITRWAGLEGTATAVGLTFLFSWIFRVRTHSYTVSAVFTSAGVVIFRTNWWNRIDRLICRMPAVNPELIELVGKPSTQDWRHVRLGSESYWFSSRSDFYLVHLSHSYFVNQAIAVG